MFKEFGISNGVSDSLLEILNKEYNIKYYLYVSFTEEEAFLEQINHNDNEQDPTRGTGIFSLKQFFNMFFEEGEYDNFIKYANEFVKKVKDYFGFKIVRTLKPNTLHNFRKTVRERLDEFDVDSLNFNRKLSIDQQKLISSHYLGDKNIEIIAGKSDFAQSFMTSEWLYSSLSEAGNIDLTAIAMGYYKSIEQFLFRFIALHTKERDAVSREIFVGKGKKFANEEGYVILTNSILKEDEFVKNINLGSLTGFFGYYNKRNNVYIKRNEDLLIEGIHESTYEYIIDVLSNIPGIRNGYFHKHNINDWEKVVEARNNAQFLFY